MKPPAGLEVKDLAAGYGHALVLDGFELGVAPGELVALLGPSGCGKTTALRVIAGLLPAVRGEVRMDGAALNGLPPERRGIAMVFQKPLLFPHMTVEENISFGLRMRHAPAAECAQRTAEALEMVRLTGLHRRLPREISGGQEQRVALARAIVTEPRVLLLDEPFSSLDERLRVEMRDLLRVLQRRLRVTAVFVTHDQDEAATLADRVALLLSGRVVQEGPAREFYTNPKTRGAAEFFGWRLFPELRLAGVRASSRGPYAAFAAGNERGAVVTLRTENAWLEPASASALTEGELRGVIESVTDLGVRVRYNVRVLEQSVPVETSDDSARLEAGQEVRLCVPPPWVRELL